MSDILQKIHADDRNIERGVLACNEYDKNVTKCAIRSVKITTITLMMQLDVKKPLVIDDLKKWLEANLTGKWVLRAKCRFYNCAVLCNNSNTGKVAIKIFRNGNLHITGAKSINLAYDNAQTVANMLREYDTKTCNLYEILSYKIQLMNGCVKMLLDGEMGICLKTLHSLLCEKSSHFCIFNNDHHPGIRMKFKHHSGRSSSVMVFQGGSILFNALLSGDELIEAYQFIIGFVCEYFSDVVKASVKNTTLSKKKFDYNKYL
jgi:TATA-box binding protein (TBP) (component of TFIID and TFIIIB)